MLQTLGVDARADLVYRALLTHPDDGVQDLAVHLNISVKDVREALDELSTQSLVRPSDRNPSGFWPLSPRAAVDLLLARQQVELAAYQQRLVASRAAATQILSECADLCPEIREAEVEQVIGIEAVRQRLAALSAQITTEVATFAPGGGHRPEDIEASREPNAKLLQRGVLMRTIYLHSAHNDAMTLDSLNRLRESGAQVRTIGSLPFRMIIMDRRRAVVPLAADARAGAVILQGTGIIAALSAIFEERWATAQPLGSAMPQDANGLNQQESEVLRLLAQGLTDESIGKRLGVSPRTARRIAAELMDRLGARSRFEAGVRAMRSGWLPNTA